VHAAARCRKLARGKARRYNPGMRHPTRLGLAVAILLLVAAVGAYSAYWFVAAGRIEGGFGQWAGSLRPQHLDLSWKALRVGGFPLVFRVKLSEAQLRSNRPGGAPGQPAELRLPLLSGTARPWNLRVWRLAAPDGLSAIAGAPAAPAAKLTAQAASGSVMVGAAGGATLWLDLTQPSADLAVHLAARDAELWLNLPAHPPQTHSEPAIGIALDLHEVTLPIVPAPFRNPVDEIALGVTVMGALAAAPPRQAAAAWRDAGGTLKLDHGAVRWGSLALTGSGTVALDADLQPIGAFSGGIEGYDALMTALVAAGRMRAGDARLARLALTMLAKTGPGGRPQIATSFTIQNGEMFLGPAKLGKAPRITWE
jgi:hypothetical protein